MPTSPSFFKPLNFSSLFLRLTLSFSKIWDSSYICFYVLGRSSLFPIDDGLLDDGHNDQVGVLNSPTCYSAHQNGERIERFSRKVFVGGLPPDIDEGKATIGALKKSWNIWTRVLEFFYL